MGRNIEIKARVGDLEQMRARVERICDGPGEEIGQEDIFFYSNQGRLKLRFLGSGRGQLIYYERGDVLGPRVSNYFIYETADPVGLREVIGQAAGVRGIVRKRRWLYWRGNVRIHIDQVDGLGSFLELEVVLGEQEDRKSGLVSAAEIMDMLKINTVDLIERAYIDLIDERDDIPPGDEPSSK